MARQVVFSGSRFLLVFVAVILMSANYTIAQGIAVSPSRISFELFRGESSESMIRIINPSEQGVLYRIDTDDYEDWFSFDDNEGFIDPQGIIEVRVRVSPPYDIQNGEYNTLINVMREQEEEGKGVAINLATSIKAKIVISGKQMVSLSVGNVEVRDTEYGIPLVVRVELLNNGNVRVIPSVEFSIKKNNRILKRELFGLEAILPGLKRDFLLNLSTAGLEQGGYNAVSRVMLDKKVVGEESVDFRILPYGSLSRSGIFESLTLENQPVLGSLVRIGAVFVNNGMINERARLRGVVILENKEIDIVESDEKLVGIGERANLSGGIKIEKPGEYRIVARVVYEGVESETKELKFTVDDKANKDGFSVLGVLFSLSIVVFGLIIFLGWRLLKMEKKDMNKERKEEEKVYYCIDCNRVIKHKGRCFACNLTAKRRREAQEKKY